MMLLIILLASVQAGAVSLSSEARQACATEISAFCGGRKDLRACLRDHDEGLMTKCAAVLNGRTGAASAAIAVSSSRAVVEPPPGGAPVPGVSGVWFEAGYSGPKGELLPGFQKAISEAFPGGLRRAAELLGQPEYSSGFSRPLVLRIEYDPTQQRGLAGLDGAQDASGRLRLTFNMAHWEDCPSRDILRSVVTHEVSHAVLHDLLGERRLGTIPQWFDEGLAMLAGGEPARSIAMDAAYARHGKDYPGSVHCPFVNEAWGLVGGGLLTECYPFYLLAVEKLAESSPDAVPGIIKDLRVGVPMENAVAARAGLGWGQFAAEAVERSRRVIGGKSFISLVTGKNWWRHVRWCRG
ncbi:MAG: hypothetical protein SF051_05985 [Elusimicrobiota bacterium]|nr:hypothetical protein [Elusimicrobiota bacterium]